MNTLYNVTEARGKLAKIGESLKEGNSASFLKNGKPLFVAIPPVDFDRYQCFLEIEKRKQWENSLPTMEISEEEVESITKAQQEIKDGKFTTLKSEQDIDEFLNNLAS